ncbi:uncharacterized protein HKW66_Vig0129860 [Vigna angularis]|uniref:Neprosin activation peptide domain-containing protein n=1 Tax=Phaseolus angularis TaxID=3914 RepID=A0A8T0K5B8_PHAAN|nr:uncharacterized protein HKW66_Vig0129860 [Vigna angularis]
MKLCAFFKKTSCYKIDELAVVVGVLLFSKARNFLSFISNTRISQGCRQGYDLTLYPPCYAGKRVTFWLGAFEKSPYYVGNLRDDTVRRGRESWAQARRSMTQRGFHGVLPFLRRLEEPVPNAGEVGGIVQREASHGSQERDKAGGEGGGWGHCGGIGEDESGEIGGLRDDENRPSETTYVLVIYDNNFYLLSEKKPKNSFTEHGDIVDCIDINKQPAFDHPLLKNHKLQEKPNFQRPIGKISGKKLSGRSMFGFDKHHCYKGTVPILRTTKENLIREKKLLNSSIFVKDISGVHLAEIAVSSKFGPYFSIDANNIVYNPTVTKGQMSLSHIWVQNGPINTNNKISMGWHNASRRNYGPEKYQTEHYLDKPKCYGLKYFGNLHQNVGCALQFGGPGGNCGD